MERLTKSGSARAGGTLFGLFEFGGGWFREQATEQTKTLQDAVFMLFEDAADESGLFDLEVDLADSTAWTDGRVHAALQPGRLVRLTAPTRILDAQNFRARVDRFAEWPRLITAFTMSDQLKSVSNPKERGRRVQAAAAQMLGGESALDGVRRIGEFMDVFLAGQISIRQFACGVDQPKLGFSGMLLGRPGYLQEEREALFAKYGSTVTPWTVVSQVASAPDASSRRTALELGELVNASDQVDRATVEDAASQLMELFESIGVAEGPAYPSIAVTPLAVFREFTPPSREPGKT